MKVRKILLVLIVMTGLIMTGCEPQSQPSETPAVEPTSTNAPQNTPVPETVNSVNNTGWLLESLDGQAVLGEAQVTINFENDRFYGTDGCNQYNGSVKLDGEKISIDDKIATTRMACEESVMQQGSEYLYMLVQAATYKVSDQQMLLLDKDGKTLATFTQMLTMTGKDPKNATYLIDDKAITLIDGVSEVEAAPGSATKLMTSYFGNGVELDLNGDGVMDSAFLLEQTSGGSGTFYYVVAALNMPDGTVGTNAILIGDRIAPQNLNIDPDNSAQFIVNYMDRNPDEPMSTQPSVGVSRWFNLQGDMLVEIDNPLTP